MRHEHPEHRKKILQLIFEYEAMSQKGTVSIIEETVFLDIINFCETTGQTEKALHFVEEAIAQHAFSSDLYVRKAELLLKAGRFAECLVTVEQAQTFAPLNIKVQLIYADILIQTKAPKAALSLLEPLIERSNACELSDIYLLEARAYEQLNQFEGMYRAARRCLLHNADNQAAYETLIIATEWTGRYTDSCLFFNRLLDRDAYNHLAWLGLGFASEALGDMAAAIEAFEYVCAIDEYCLTAYEQAGDLLIQEKDFIRALYLFESAVFKIGENALLLQKIGYCHSQLQSYSVADAYFGRALELTQTDATLFFYRGQNHAATGQWQAAIRCYEQAIALDKRNETFFAAIAKAYVATEKYAQAIASFRKAAHLAPDVTEYWLDYATFLMGVRQEKMALRVLDEAENYTFGAEMAYCRIACLFSMGRYAEALSRLDQALSDDFDKHEQLLKWCPELAENADFQAIIEAAR